MKKIGMKKMTGVRKRGAAAPKAMAAPRAMRDMAVPPMAGPMPQGMPGMKKGGAVKKDMVGTGKTPAAAKADYKKKMAKGAKGGLGIMIILGKKKGK